MKNFYVTYGCGTNLRNCYSAIQAVDYDDAMNIVFTEIGSAFAFMYDKTEFAGQAEKYGMHEVELQPMRTIE